MSALNGVGSLKMHCQNKGHPTLCSALWCSHDDVCVCVCVFLFPTVAPGHTEPAGVPGTVDGGEVLGQPAGGQDP